MPLQLLRQTYQSRYVPDFRRTITYPKLRITEHTPWYTNYFFSYVFCGANTVAYSKLLDGWPGRYTSGFAEGLLSPFPDV